MPAKKEPEPEQASAVGVFSAFIDDLARNATITADIAGIIKHAIQHHKDKLEAAFGHK